MAKPIWSGLSLQHVFDFYCKFIGAGSIVKIEHDGHRYKFETNFFADPIGCILWEDIDKNANINFLLTLSAENKCTIMIKDRVYHADVTLVERFDISQDDAPCARLTCRSGDDVFIIRLE